MKINYGVTSLPHCKLDSCVSAGIFVGREKILIFIMGTNEGADNKIKTGESFNILIYL